MNIPLHERIMTRHNNLNFIRFVAALLVIMSHSFSVTEGAYAQGTPLDVITQTRLSFGGVAVAFFFFYSGLLIAKSCETHKRLPDFFNKRIVRIFPELIVCVLVSVCGIGLAVTTLSPLAYLTNPQSYRYLLNMIMIPVHTLPGVFADNPYPFVVNASLWTIPAEFICYVGCFALYKACEFRPRVMAWLTCAVAVLVVLYIVCAGNYMLSFVRALVEFYLGMLAWTWRTRVVLSRRLAALAGMLWLLLVLVGQDTLAMILVFPYLALWLGWGTSPVCEHFSEKQDYSYGIFLWGFPVQQLLVHMMPGMLWWENMLLGWIIAFTCAFASTQLLRYVRAHMYSRARS